MIEPLPQAPARDVVDAVRTLARLTRFIDRASDSLSSADYRVMSAIVEGEARASRLANRLLLGKPAISSTVESLSKRGLIVKSSVEGDNRAVELALSDEGAELFARMEVRMTDQLERLASATPDAAQVLQSLNWLGDAIEATMRARENAGASA